ncbi:ABC transporter ATP-binding protein [Streptosporangium sp. KLBMP 9127]|nr:ABC transporter ATP-binding protein/permease [Streptosporangium sp. KLBMP 9127]
MSRDPGPGAPHHELDEDGPRADRPGTEDGDPRVSQPGIEADGPRARRRGTDAGGDWPVIGPGALLYGTLRRRPARLLRIAGWSVVEAAPAFVIGLAVARAIEDGFAAGRPATGLAWLALLGGTWLVAAVGARQVILAVAAVAEPFRDELLGHVVAGAMRRATASFRSAGPGSAAVARANLQVELARDSFAAVVTVVRSFLFTLVGVVLGMLTLVPEALVLALPPFAVGLALFLLSLPALARRQREFLLADERTAEALSSMAGGLRDIAACGAEDTVGNGTERAVAAQAAAARRLARVTAVRTAALAVGAGLPVLLVLAGTPWLLSTGAGAGTVVGVLAYVTQSLGPALGGLVEGLGVSGVALVTSLGRILRSLPPAVPVIARAVPQGDDLSLRAVTFAYGPHAEPVVDRLDLVVPAGDHLAIVGPSGAGKSTLAALITGVLPPDAGEIRLGGVLAGEVVPAARVLIPQEAYVFRGTLAENFGFLADVPQADMAAAVRALGAGELVTRCGGYQAEIDPAALSAGQRQLVALVRAYLAPARMVVLDEATCHLDPAAEERVERAFASRGGTLIVVAHRLSSAVRARHVLLVDGTRVLKGTHDELVRAVPLYADLVGHWQPEPVS